MTSLSSLKIYLRNAEVSDKGLTLFFKSIAKIESLRWLKVNLMNNEITEKSMKMGSPHL